MTFHRILWHYVSISKHLLEFCVEGQAVEICSMYLTTNSFVVPKTLSDNVTFPKSKAWFSMSVTSMYSMYLCTYHEMFVSIKHVHFRICFQSILSGKKRWNSCCCPSMKTARKWSRSMCRLFRKRKQKRPTKDSILYFWSHAVFFFLKESIFLNIFI